MSKSNPKKRDNSDLIAFRSRALKRELQAIAKANPGQSGLVSAIIVAAISEKLERMKQGEERGIIVRIALPGDQSSENASAGADADIAAETARRVSRRRKKSS